MKKHANTTLKSTVIVLLSTFLVGVSTNAKASLSSDTLNKPQVAITFAGENEKILAFNIHYDNREGKPFLLELTADGHELLYQEKFNDKNFNKNLYLQNEREDCKLSFIIRDKKEVYKQTFHVSKLKKEQKDLVIVKL